MPSLRSHSNYSTLKQAFRKTADAHSLRWNKSVYRCVTLRWANPAYLISGEGSIRNGSRWMMRGVTPVVYAASTEHIALKEAQSNFDRYGIKPKKHPRVVVELEIRLSSIIDLPGLLQSVTWPQLPELLAEDWNAINDQGMETLSQASGRALFELGYEGVRVPSTKDARGYNLFFFPENRKEGSLIKIVGEQELKKYLA